ncbi:MAG: hypothetical protein U5R48_12305 [Gammaproteobacteria bacterium]|nr:hypothetical protein [Gammaproteobacteria bacterium]
MHRSEVHGGVVTEGFNRLPITSRGAAIPRPSARPALVYEFEKPETSDAQLVTAGRLTAQEDILARSGLLNAIGMDVED